MLGQGIFLTRMALRMRTGGRLASTVGVVALLALVGAACGGGDDADGDDAAGAVTVEHRYGTTTVPQSPENIVSLDTQWTDVLVALDATPVGYLRDPNIEGDLPWRSDELAEATALDATDALPYEQIAGLEPDLIVASYLIEDESVYGRLSDIAPTIPLLTDRQVDSWQDMAQAAGKVLGAEGEAQALIDEVAATVAEVAVNHPGIEGRTVALANYVPGDAIYVVADPEDGANVVFADLGLTITPTILDAGGEVSGRVTLSLEQASMLDADILVLFTNGADVEEITGYDRLPAVRSGAVAVLDYGAVVGLNTPTPLSVPYSLELIEPALAAAEAA